MQQQEVEVTNESGMDAPASAEFVRLAGTFQCNLAVARSGRKVNAKSLMGVMMLAAAKGSRIILEADGPDETQALDALVELVANNFRAIDGRGAT
jgi:phosphocarrier protein